MSQVLVTTILNKNLNTLSARGISARLPRSHMQILKSSYILNYTEIARTENTVFTFYLAGYTFNYVIQNTLTGKLMRETIIFLNEISLIYERRGPKVTYTVSHILTDVARNVLNN
uniref:Uncharacterized protein n=1 Tax=Cacopsylla melanoneura TaxID=428564 RepID=A0A8D9EMK6_9HEMI